MLVAQAAQAAETGYCLWWWRERSSGELVGYVGLNRDEVEGEPVVEVGWSIAPARWGEGFAPEAARAAVAWGFERCGLERIVSFTLPENAALPPGDGEDRDDLRARVRARGAAARALRTPIGLAARFRSMLEAGDTAPDFTLRDQHGEPRDAVGPPRGDRRPLFLPARGHPGLHDPGLRDPRPPRRLRRRGRPGARRLARHGRGDRQVRRQARARLHPARRSRPRRWPRPTGPGSRSATTARPTWASSARPSSSTRRARSPR